MGEGLPQYKNPFEKGRLIIQFDVVFPNALPVEYISMLEQCLPPRPVVHIPINAEECNLMDWDADHEQRRRHKQAYDEDDDSYHQGPRVQQCTTS